MANDKRVELIGIDYHAQGTNDGLCVYYSACTLLATLVPEKRKVLGAGDRVRRAGFRTKDPILAAAAAKESNTPKHLQVAAALTKWFFDGFDLENVVGLMNTAAREYTETDTSFLYFGKGTHDKKNAERGRRSLDDGLPFMLAWNSRAYGDHCAAVTGYRFDGDNTWFTLADPGGWDRHSWAELTAHGRNIEMILPNPEAFPEHRPDVEEWEEDPDGEIKKHGVYRWWPTAGANGDCDWVEIKSLFHVAQQTAGRPEKKAG